MTRVKQAKQLPKQGLSSTKPRGRALFPCRDGSQVSHKGIERLYGFQRIRCTICLTSSENHQKKEDHTLKACACLQHLSWSCFTSKAGAAVVKNGVSGCSARHPTRRNEGSKGSQRTAGAAGHHKMADKRKAFSCALLRWITKLNCVNWEIQSVVSHPQRGCLQWLHGTMSEPPWILH